MTRRMGVAVACVALLATAPLLAAGRPPALVLWKGKYPFNRVAGTTFIGHPPVKAGVRRAAPSPAIARTILDPGVATPIDVTANWIVSGACEPHNCGEHGWSILVNRRTGIFSVCHKPEGGGATWYRAGRSVGAGQSCASEVGEVPAAVLR